MMTIMHEPDKKNAENGFLSLFCIFQSQQTREGGEKNQGRKKKGVFLLWELNGLGVCCLKDSTVRCTMLRYSARSGLTFPSVRTSLWKCAALLLPHAITETPLS